jgi:hypothetical protein
LAALVLDFIEQADVLDRDGGLVSESRYQLDLLLSERPHFAARQGKEVTKRSRLPPSPHPKARLSATFEVAARAPPGGSVSSRYRELLVGQWQVRPPSPERAVNFYASPPRVLICDRVIAFWIARN